MCENPMIREAEKFGGGGMMQDLFLPCGHLESENCTCRQIAEQRQDEMREDERLWE